MARRTFGPKRREPYFTEKQLNDEATLLLAEYGDAFGHVVVPPVPIDDIVELHLRLTFEFLDMQKTFGVGDVHGALWVNDQRVGVDISLDPDRNPSKLGRYRFTLAHEAGHWRLHRHLFKRQANQPSLLPDVADRADYVCRSSDKSPLEWQADSFAAALLMPRTLVLSAWEQWQGNLNPIYLEDLQQQRHAISGYVSDDDRRALFEHTSRPLAIQFQVSPQAMSYRLQSLQLFQTEKEASLFD